VRAAQDAAMMLIQHILDDARTRLAVLGRTAPLTAAAKILANPATPLAIVCDDEGIALGVVSRADIVKAFCRASSDVFATSVAAIMTRDVLSFQVNETLQSVWAALSTRRGLRCAPVLDSLRRPQGVVHARDIARALLDEVANEEQLLRDYVLGVGYQ
jgi:CBS domain-containing protein